MTIAIHEFCVDYFAGLSQECLDTKHNMHIIALMFSSYMMLLVMP